MAHKFFVRSAHPLPGTLIYSESERGFSFIPRDINDLAGLVGGGGRTSLVADTLQLEVSVDTGRALYVWGYMPKETWRTASLGLPESRHGSIIVEVGEPPLEESISVSIARTNWDILFDQETGIVCVVRNQLPTEHVVEIAEGTYLGLNGMELTSIWLNPEFVA